MSEMDSRLSAEWRALADDMGVRAGSEMIALSGPERASLTAVIAEIEDVNVTLEELQASIDEGMTRRMATRRWTVRDVVAHLASWACRTRVEAERLLRGDRFDEIVAFGLDGPHAWNQREVDRRRDRTLDALFAEMAAEHERLVSLVAFMSDEDRQRVFELPRTIGVPPQPWHMPLGSMIIMSCWHARLHLRRLRRILREEA